MLIFELGRPGRRARAQAPADPDPCSILPAAILRRATPLLPEVSELDFSNALQLEGFTIPTIATRRATTVVELADGQSFAIAGLLKDNVREAVKKFPVFGDIPVLGALFRSSRYVKNQTELVIIVTPHFVKPLDMVQQTLPTDTFTEPNDWEFYLTGRTDGFGYVPQAKQARDGRVVEATVSRRLEGEFVHMVQ